MVCALSWRICKRLSDKTGLATGTIQRYLKYTMDLTEPSWHGSTPETDACEDEYLATVFFMLYRDLNLDEPKEAWRLQISCVVLCISLLLEECDTGISYMHEFFRRKGGFTMPLDEFYNDILNIYTTSYSYLMNISCNVNGLVDLERMRLFHSGDDVVVVSATNKRKHSVISGGQDDGK